MKIQAKILLTCSLVLSSHLYASSLVYIPQNPSFGGNPNNGAILLNSANAQNKIKDPALNEELTALEDFNDRLQRSLLSSLTRTIANSVIDTDGNLIPGETVTADFVINVVDEGNGTTSVTTTDRATGEATIFVVESAI